MGKKTDFESVHLVNHSKCMLAAFQNFLQDSSMLDVTLACNGQSLKAHKLLLSACSPFFKDLLAENPCAHPIIILRDFDFADLKAVIDFIYKGELSVPRERLISALKVAEELNVRGLCRSESSTKKYETLYKKICSKSGSRKKRKKHNDSSDFNVKQFLNVSDSDENMEHDTVLKRKSLSQNLDFEDSYVINQDSRPFVLKVGDQSINNEDMPVKPENSDVEINQSTILDSDKTKIEAIDTVVDVKSLSQVETDIKNLTDSSKQIESNPVEKHIDFHGDFNVKSSNQKNLSLEQISNISFVSLPESAESSTAVYEEEKCFVCSKCDSVFTSQIDFMHHKMECCENFDIYKCQHCSFSTNDIETFKNHEHASQVPYNCKICFMEFTSEKLYEKHLAVHDENSLQTHDVSLKFGHGLFPSHSKNQEKLVLFRCSVCFTKFTSKLSCQLHEKSCQGKS